MNELKLIENELVPFTKQAQVKKLSMAESYIKF